MNVNVNVKLDAIETEDSNIARVNTPIKIIIIIR